MGSHCQQPGRFWGEPARGQVLALRCPHAVRRLDRLLRQPLRFLRFLLFFGLPPSVRTRRYPAYPSIRPLHPVEVEDAQLPGYFRQLPITPQLGKQNAWAVFVPGSQTMETQSSLYTKQTKATKSLVVQPAWSGPDFFLDGRPHPAQADRLCRKNE